MRGSSSDCSYSSCILKISCPAAELDAADYPETVAAVLDPALKCCDIRPVLPTRLLTLSTVADRHPHHLFKRRSSRGNSAATGWDFWFHAAAVCNFGRGVHCQVCRFPSAGYPDHQIHRPRAEGLGSRGAGELGSRGAAGTSTSSPCPSAPAPPRFFPAGFVRGC